MPEPHVLLDSSSVIHEVTAEISPDGKYIDMGVPSYLTYKVENMPGYRRIYGGNDRGYYDRIPLEPVLVRRLKEEFGKERVDVKFSAGPKLKKWYAAEVRRERIMRRISISGNTRLKRVPNDLVWYGPGNVKKELRSFQRADIKLMAMRHFVNANQMGAGKTSEVILSLHEADLIHGFHLVNAPVAALEDPWTIEIESLYKALGLDPPTILTGTNPVERKLAIAEAVELFNEGYSFWLLINPAMIRVREQQWFEGKMITKAQYKALDGWQQATVDTTKEMDYAELLEVDWTSFTIDEFHLMGLSNRSTQGRLGCEEIRDQTKPSRIFPVSGTPMRGKFKKLFGALQFAYPDKFANEAAWAKAWLNTSSEEIEVNGKTVRVNDLGSLQEERAEEFQDYHRRYLIRRTTREALPGMPEKVHVDVWCQMSERQQDQYETFALEAEWRIAEVETTLIGQGKRLTATNILTEYTRLRQFADAYCEVSEDPKTERLIVKQTPDSGKLEQLMEKLAEEAVFDKKSPAPALLFSQFNPMVRMVTRELEKNRVKVAIINGETVAKGLAREYREAFQRGDINVLILNTAAGTALNLARAESVHLLDETWAPDDQEQCEDRAFGGHRAMNKEPGRCYYYRTRNTIEEYVMEICGGKAFNNRMALDLRQRVQASLPAETR